MNRGALPCRSRILYVRVHSYELRPPPPAALFDLPLSLPLTATNDLDPFTYDDDDYDEPKPRDVAALPRPAHACDGQWWTGRARRQPILKSGAGQLLRWFYSCTYYFTRPLLGSSKIVDLHLLLFLLLSARPH